MFWYVRSAKQTCSLFAKTSRLQRQYVTTQDISTKNEGDISSVFRSLSSDSDEALPERFADIKLDLTGNRDILRASWNRLLRRLQEESEIVKAQGSDCIPEIQFSDLDNAGDDFNRAIRERGVAVIRQVIPEKEARGYKEEVEAYIAANPSTRGLLPSCVGSVTSF